MKKPFIVLAGPTATGKTKYSVPLAKALGGEIISADSMQVYKEMDIGSAKIGQKEMQGVPHYMIDELMPDEEFNVVLFQQKAKAYMEDIYRRGKIPILVGGTGFYIQAVLYDIDFTDTDEDLSYREELEHLARTEGDVSLHRRLQAVDPAAAAQIHPNNRRRVIRALEYFHQSGERISEHNEREREKESPYSYVYFVLNDKRERLYEGIDQRVDQMLGAGLVDEVAGLRNKGYTKDLTSMQGLGYKEIFDYLEGNCLLEEAVYRVKRDTRRFAKRQLTWFRRERGVTWIDKSEYDYDDAAILAAMLQQVKIIL